MLHISDSKFMFGCLKVMMVVGGMAKQRKCTYIIIITVCSWKILSYTCSRNTDLLAALYEDIYLYLC